MSEFATLLLAEAAEKPLWIANWGSPTVGTAAFVAVFAALTLWLLLIPGRLIGQADGRPPWHRNVRVWAVLVAVTQMLVYVLLGRLSG